MPSASAITCKVTRDILLSVGFTALFLLSLFGFPALLIHGLGYEVITWSLGLLVVTFVMYFSPTPGASISEGCSAVSSGISLSVTTWCWSPLPGAF